jgi:acylphosphatase
MKHYNIKITGRVQGIGFRFSAMQVAYRYEVKGYVQNLKEGAVYIEAEGEEENISRFLQWCRSGPLGARVDNAEITEGEVKDFKSFDIVSSKGNT